MGVKEFLGTVSEATEQRHCIQYLNRLKDFKVYRINTGAARYKNKDGTERFVKYGTKATPDLGGRYKSPLEKRAIPFYFEVKKKGGRLTQDQKEFIESALDDGCYASYGTFEDLQTYLKNEGLDMSYG